MELNIVVDPLHPLLSNTRGYNKDNTFGPLSWHNGQKTIIYPHLKGNWELNFGRFTYESIALQFRYHANKEESVDLRTLTNATLENS